MNLIIAGEKVFYDGEIFKLQRGFKLLFNPVRNHIPIYIASIAACFVHPLAACAGYAVVAAVFAEYAGAVEGLGIYMQVAKNSFRTDLVLAAVVVTAVLTLVLYALTYLVERVCIPWERAGVVSGA